MANTLIKLGHRFIINVQRRNANDNSCGRNFGFFENAFFHEFLGPGTLLQGVFQLVLELGPLQFLLSSLK